MGFLTKLLGGQKKEDQAHSFNQEVVDKANSSRDELDRLNRLLKANGITLKIYIASGGDHRGH